MWRTVASQVRDSIMAAPYPTGPAGAPVSSAPSSKVELYISCKNLIDTDILSKSDPIVAVYTVDNGGRAVEVSQGGTGYCLLSSLSHWCSVLALSG